MPKWMKKRVEGRAKSERRPAGCAQIGVAGARTEGDYMKRRRDWQGGSKRGSGTETGVARVCANCREI